jgi:hypothetical protein
MSSEYRHAPMITKTDGWYRDLNKQGELRCGWCLPAYAALVQQAEPMRRYLNTKFGDFYVLQPFQVDDLTPEEKNAHKACALD